MITNYSNEQKEVIEAPLYEKTIVIASPAAGKTRCATERLRYVLEQGIDPKSVVMLTFTNNAALEMSQRIPDKFKQDGHPFMGTIHAYANFLLTKNGHDTQEYRSEDRFDELFELVYENPDIVPKLNYLIVDEMQDLNFKQFDFIEWLNPTGHLFVGDTRQSIYGFQNARPEYLRSLMKKEDIVVRELTENYRNARLILNHSNKILDKMIQKHGQYPKGIRSENGIVRYISLLQAIDKIRMSGKWDDWAILCRSNAQVSSIIKTLKKQGIPCITFRQAQGTLIDLQKKMEENVVKVLTVHSSKGLEFNKVIIYGLFPRGEEEFRINYVAVTRAKDELYFAK